MPALSISENLPGEIPLVGAALGSGFGAGAGATRGLGGGGGVTAGAAFGSVAGISRGIFNYRMAASSLRLASGGTRVSRAFGPWAVCMTETRMR